MGLQLIITRTPDQNEDVKQRVVIDLDDNASLKQARQIARNIVRYAMPYYSVKIQTEEDYEPSQSAD